MSFKDKSPEMQSFIDNLSESMTGKKTSECIDNRQCPFCDTPNFDFRDELSRKEYSISGLCQNCQDKVFGE